MGERVSCNADRRREGRLRKLSRDSGKATIDHSSARSQRRRQRKGGRRDRRRGGKRGRTEARRRRTHDIKVEVEEEEEEVRVKRDAPGRSDAAPNEKARDREEDERSPALTATEEQLILGMATRWSEAVAGFVARAVDDLFGTGPPPPPQQQQQQQRHQGQRGGDDRIGLLSCSG